MSKDALSRERIVEAAIALLDEHGEDGLTFRALAQRLETGAGAIYWHIENKGDLLTAATDAVIARAMGEAKASASPRAAIRAIAVGVFEAIDAHPWLGKPLSSAPPPIATMQIFERIGREVQALGGSSASHFTAAQTLLSFILGVSAQNAEQGRVLEGRTNRTDFLEREAARWKKLDADQYPFTRSVATLLRKHDDREEFLGGIDLIVAGLAPKAR